jgi:catechol 2,3-dioxygenase-like lactoylglutathione lyase family enzyme
MSDPTPNLDHVALLVSSLERSLERLEESGLAAGPIESFPSEGTREVYLGDPDRPARLLLLEATAEGPYQRSLRKRGPGLHHVAFEAPELEAFAAQVRGWLLHPHSLQSHKGANTLWFARPGVGTLLEVTRGTPLPGELQLQVGVSLQDEALGSLLEVARGLEAAPAAGGWLEVGGRRFDLTEVAS